jgi:hypothetical protein
MDIIEEKLRLCQDELDKLRREYVQNIEQLIFVIDLVNGRAVRVKNTADLIAVFESKTSQWSREFNTQMQKNRERQMKMAGQVGVVNDVDPDNKTVRVKVNNSNAWFTLDMLSFENSSPHPAEEKLRLCQSNLVNSDRRLVEMQQKLERAIDLVIGREVRVKNTADLIAVFESKTNQWSRDFDSIMQHNRERQMKMAGQVGVVNDVDPDDKIVRVKVNNSNAWFTLDMLSFENSVTTTATVAS